MPCIETLRSSLTQKNSSLSDSCLKIVREGTRMLMCPSQLVPGTALVCTEEETLAVCSVVTDSRMCMRNVSFDVLAVHVLFSLRLLLQPHPKFWAMSPLQAWCLSCHTGSSPGFLFFSGLVSIMLMFLPHCLCSLTAC